jgi:hypothetical protein
MTDVKTQELSYDEWRELLKPFGHADITVRIPAVWFPGPPPLLEYEIRVMLKPSPGHELGEWAERSYLLEQAQQAVEAVRAKGHLIEDAPHIEFGGRYMYRCGERAPLWVPEASLRFDVGARR